VLYYLKSPPAAEYQAARATSARARLKNCARPPIFYEGAIRN
jgi:hypothetical protein